jgi:hypothetical protein
LQIPHQVQTRPGICAYTIVLAAQLFVGVNRNKAE